MATWVQGTPEGDWTSMAVPSDGSYGIEEGLVYSFPVRCAGGDYEIVQGLDVSKAIGEKIEGSERELKDERDTVKELLPS